MKTMRHYRAFAAIASLLALSVGAPAVLAAASADFTIRSESATFNARTDTVTFRIVFSQVPDFFTVDEYGRPADTFQYWVGGDSLNAEVIIRGVEIRFTDGLIPVRNVAPEDPDLVRSGGWGTIRGEVPYTLRGRVLSFSVPLSLLTDQSDPDTLAYEVAAFEFGATTNSLLGTIRLR